MKLTVLGKSPAWQDVDGACSGYLVEHRRRHLLVDCGNGVLAQLRRYLRPRQLEAVFISHMHADHFFDLIPLAYLLRHAPAPIGMPRSRPQLFLPTGARATLRMVCGGWGAEGLIDETFEVHDYLPGQCLEAAGVELELAAVPHYVPTVAARISAGGATITYGADCGPNAALPELAHGGDALICEATMPEDQNKPGAGHLSARQAGEVATAAGVPQLILTHFSDLLSGLQMIEQCASAYDGEIRLARAGLEVDGR